jgi:hypothetical protein
MATTVARNTLVQRLIGAAALDAAIYEEVEGDASALPQAFAIVIASSLAAGIGARGLTTVTVAAYCFTARSRSSPGRRGP